MNRLPRHIERKVLEMHFTAVPRDTIANELGISSGAVSEILSILPPNLEGLRNLSKDLRRENMILSDAQEAVVIREELRKLNVKPDQFALSIQAVTRLASDTGFSAETVVKAATRLVEIEAQTGKSYSQATKDFASLKEKIQEKMQQHEELEERNLQLQTIIKINEEKEKQAYAAAGEAPGDISRFKKQKTKLAQCGISLNNVDTISKFLDNTEGTDPKQMVNLVKRVGSLEKATRSLGSKIYKMSLESETLSKQNEIAERSLWQKNHEVNALDHGIQLRQAALANLDHWIAARTAQIRSTEKAYKEINDLLKATIAQLGKLAGMDDALIANLQLTAQIHLVKAVIENKIAAYMKDATEVLARLATV